MTKKTTASKIIYLVAFLAFALVNPSFSQENGGGSNSDDPDPIVNNVFVKFDPISVSIIRDYRIQGQLAVTFFISVHHNSTVAKIESLRPKIRDGMIQALTQVANTRVSPNRPVDVKLLDLFMQRSLDETLGEGLAEVLIQSAAAQPY